MVLLLVLLTFALFITIALLAASKKQPAQAVPAPAAPRVEIDNRFLHPGHAWVFVQQSRLATIGVDDFTRRLLGKVSHIDLPGPNSVIHQGDPLVTLRRSNGKAVTVVSPLSGILTQVNEALAVDTEAFNTSPYGDGWIAKIIPFNLTVELRNLMRGSMASMWREALRMQLVQWFAPKLGPVLQDGGEFVENLSDLIPDDEWPAMLNEFYPPIHHDHHHSSKR